MRVLWVVNGLIGGLRQRLAGARVDSGGWMDVMLEALMGRQEIELTVATTGIRKTILYHYENGVTYYQLPAKTPLEYKYQSKRHIEEWRNLIDVVKPELLHIWGSEYAHGLTAMKLAECIPSLLLIQGLVDSVARYYEAAMTPEEIRCYTTLRDMVRQDSIWEQKKRYARRAIVEREMIRRADNIMCDNEWGHAHCRAIKGTDSKFYRSPELIREPFHRRRWSLERAMPYTIVAAASEYPLKGLHILLKALSLVKRHYPEIRLHLPGMAYLRPQGLTAKLRQSGYTAYINALIDMLSLRDHIVFEGKLTAVQMAELMERSHLCVISSAMENICCTLREAMLVGLPVISSFVGGLQEIIRHGENGMFYPFGEYEVLAQQIMELFARPALAQRLAVRAAVTMTQMLTVDPAAVMLETYKDILHRCK